MVEEMAGAGWVLVVMAAAMHVEMRLGVVRAVGVARGGGGMAAAGWAVASLVAAAKVAAVREAVVWAVVVTVAG